MRNVLLASALAVLPALSAFAADNPWNGTWKLDLAKSKFTGDTITYSKLENGRFHFTDGSAESYDFGTDGKEYQAYFGYKTTWTPAGDNAWDSVVKFNGTVVNNVHRQISSNGKTLTVTSKGTKPDGSSFNDEYTYTRLTGTTSLVGKWKSTKVNISASDTFVVSSPSDGVLRWEFPEYKQTVEGKSDGSDLPATGPTTPAGTTVAIKILSLKKLAYTVKISGKPVSIATQTLSADGKTLTDVSWSPGKESEKATAVYTKK
jgi:hypothetical protein